MDRKKFVATACAACGVAAVISVLDSCTKTDVTPVNFTIDLTNPAIMRRCLTPGRLCNTRIM